MNRMIYFCADLEAETPVLVGSGEQNYSDQDMIRGSDGVPFIPGSTLAGVCRHYLSCVADEKTEEGLSLIDSFFGKNDRDKEKEVESKFIFYDAFIKDTYHLALREGVRIGENGVAVEGGKFDFEILKEGCTFCFRIAVEAESKIEEETVCCLFTAIEYGIQNGEIKIGGKTSRGYGKFMMKNTKRLSLDLEKDFDQFLSFQWEDVINDFEGCMRKPESMFETLRFPFSVNSFFMVSNQASLVENQKGEQIMAEQLCNGESKGAKPVIPGTSWAGVFRHHFVRLLQKCGYENQESFIKEVFGFVNEETKMSSTSKISFCESVIDKAHLMNRTRNAVDRFTGGACEKKLFTVRPAYGGEGILEIRIAKDMPHKELVYNLLDICIQDFNDGFAYVGGDGGIGGGGIRFQKGDEMECTKSIQQ